MKKFTILMVPAIAMAIGFTSCDKTPVEPTIPKIDTPQTTAAPTPVTPSAGDGMWGAMIALEMKFTINNPQLPVPVTTSTDMGIASFYDNNNGSGNLVDAGTVSINGNDLEKNTNNSYTLTATTGMTPSTLDLGSTVSWKVSGGSGISAITHNHTTSGFPDYTGTTPTEIDRSKDLEVDLGSNVSGADSVYVVIVTTSKTIIKAYGANPAPSKATITASELSGLSAVDDNTAYFEVVPFTYEVSTISGKKYAFIKEAAVVTAVNVK